MKRFVSILMAVLTLTAFCATAFADNYYYVNSGTLNLRNGPGKNYEVISRLPENSRVSVIEKGKDWSLVEPVGGNRVGYVMTVYLSKNRSSSGNSGGTANTGVAAAVKALKVLDKPYTTVIKTTKPTNYVHLRWIPDTGARYIDKYLRDTEIRVLAESKTWAQVEIVSTGYVGFILRSCVADPA